MNLPWALNITGGFLLLLISVACEKQENLPDVDVYGHAGTSLYADRSPYPQNTKESVLYAFDVLDADGVEVDVQMTKDSVLVLFHDGVLDELTKMTGCIPAYNYAEIKDMGINGTKYKLTLLTDVITLCAERDKSLFLDMKPYNYCISADVDHAVLNNALNVCLAFCPAGSREKITINTRNSELLLAITDTAVSKSFETENIDLGLSIINDGTADELCINATSMTAEIADHFRQLGIPFSIFGVKTPKEISDAVEFVPGKIITDNIAYTRKITN